MSRLPWVAKGHVVRRGLLGANKLAYSRTLCCFDTVEMCRKLWLIHGHQVPSSALVVPELVPWVDYGAAAKRSYSWLVVLIYICFIFPNVFLCIFINDWLVDYIYYVRLLFGPID